MCFASVQERGPGCGGAGKGEMAVMRAVIQGDRAVMERNYGEGVKVMEDMMEDCDEDHE
ncbi:hypothetical protein [Bartonella bacilliformis]|uniref:hypothetical protein n=1 Tax=Bartonella bacilliformis TaxID=774 RepID=UPI000ABA0ED9